MSRPLRLIIVIILLLVAACTGIAWLLLGSEAGLRFAAGQVKARAGDTVEWSRLEGSLLGPLHITGLRLSLPGQTLSADTLRLSWQPAALLGGSARVKTLRGTGIRLALTASPGKPEAAPFHPEDIALPLDVALDDIAFTDLQLSQDGQPPIQVDSLALSATLEGRQLTLRRLSLRLPQGGISLGADTVMATNMPLNLEATWDWQLALPADPGAATPTGGGTAQLSGDITLQGKLQWRERIGIQLGYRLQTAGIQAFNSDLPGLLEASGEITGTLVGDELHLRRASLNLAETPVSLSLAGEITALSAPEPQAAVTLDWEGLRWPLRSQGVEIASDVGRLRFEGEAAHYRLTLEAALSGQAVPASNWTLAGSGNSTALTINHLRGQLQGGELSIAGDVQWSPALRWNLQLDARGLDPGQWQPALPGSVDLAITTRGEIDPDAGLQADVLLSALSGRLLDFPLQGNARVKVAGDLLRITSLTMDSGGNGLSASGEVSADRLAIDWELDADNPSSLLLDAAGELAASGSITGTPEAPRVQARVSGKQLSWGTYQVPALTANLSAGTGAEDRLQFELATDGVLDGENLLLSSLQVQATGSTAEHRLSGTVATIGEQLEVRLDGGLDQQMSAWQGHLSRLSLGALGYGQWALDAPATLSLAADQATLGNSCLQTEGGTGRLCIQGQWLAVGDSAMQGRLEGLPLELFVPAVTGPIDGELSAVLGAGGQPRVTGAITLGNGNIKLRNKQKLAHGGGKLALRIKEDGLLAELDLIAPEQGRLQAWTRLPALNSLPLADEQPLQGSFSAALPDLSGLAAWVPEIGSSAGRVAVDVELAGSLSEPRVEGTLSLEEGAATLPVADLAFEDIELHVASDRGQPDRLAVSGSLRSGPGQLKLNGRIDLANSELELSLGGENFQAFDTPDAMVLLTPDLHITWRDDTLNLRGQLTIPQASITPKIQLSPAALAQGDTAEEIPGQAIAPSADVVVVRKNLEYQAEIQLTEAPFRINSNIRVAMGDYVRVSAAGFVSQITGAVDFVNTPQQGDLIPIANGRFSLQDGTFRAFGQDLEIETGHLIFANVPATEPELNLRAIRWIDNDPQVTAAGVLLTGTLTRPSLELFSRPQLEANEIQSYLLTGSSPRSKNSMLGIGAYVSPRIYVGYGYNMLERTSEFNSLFNISPRFGVGSSVGEADNTVNLTFTYEH